MSLNGSSPNKIFSLINSLQGLSMEEFMLMSNSVLDKVFTSFSSSHGL